MTFSARNGTRGARQPGGKLALWANRMMARRIRKSGRAAGFNALVLTTVGRKTGAARETPVGYFPGSNGSFLIVASAGGAPRNPAWYYNLAAHPDNVGVETAGRQMSCTAQELHGADRDEAWQQITTAAPRFASYQTKTDREIPIIRLTPNQ